MGSRLKAQGSRLSAVVLLTWLLGSLLVVSGCGSADDSGDPLGRSSSALTTPYAVTIAVPADRAPSRVALGAEGNLVIHDSSIATRSSDEGPWPICSNAAAGTTIVHSQASVGDVYAVGLVTLRNNVTVNGALLAPAIAPEPGDSYPEWSATTPGMRTFSRTVEVPSPMPTIWTSVERRTDVLAPGAYGNYNVKSDGALELSAGRYVFQSLAFEPSAQLRLAGAPGAVYIYVLGGFTFRGTQVLPSAEHEVFVGVLGTGTAELAAPFMGAVIASRGSIILGDGTSTMHQGQFFAQNIELRSGTTVMLREFENGLWEDADECAWGAPPGDECAYDVACPSPSSRHCVDQACTCEPKPGAAPTDECSYYTLDASGQPAIAYLAAGEACTPGYQCSGTGQCDGRGYCWCHGAQPTDGGECTEVVAGTTSLALRPVADGTGCSGHSGTCSVAPTCHSGVCRCTTPMPPSGGVVATCDVRGKTCAGFHCADGVCNSNLECECSTPAQLPLGSPVRIGTQNVHALPNWETKVAAGCEEEGLFSSYDEPFACEARLMAEKIRQSGYDIIVLNEAFHEAYARVIVQKLYPDHFPYIIRSMGSAPTAGVNSGLMLLSRWPFAEIDPNDEACFSTTGRMPGSELPIWAIGEGVSTYEPGVAYPKVNKAIHFEEYEPCNGPDCWAAKGLGHARVLAPGGLVLDVFFTHLQAQDQSFGQYGNQLLLGKEYSDYQIYGGSEPPRRAQLTRINEIVECVMSHRTAPNDIAVLLGDLNMNGDLSNPSASTSWEGALDCPTPLTCTLAEPLWADPVETRNEWDFQFNRTGGIPNVNAVGLLDTWAYTMTSQCVPARGAQYSPDNSASGGENCQVVGALPTRPLDHQSGTVRFDRGATQAMNPTGEERLDYILLGQHGAPGVPYWPYYPQHISRAFNLLKGNTGPSGFSRAPGRQNVLAGSDPITDHFGLNMELDFHAARMNPAEAYLLASAHGGGFATGVLPYETAVHWYKVTEPGDWVFSVNPKNQLWPGGRGPDTGVTFQVYDNTDLSKPRPPIKGEVVAVPPRLYVANCTSKGDICTDTWSLPGYRQGKFTSDSFPLYIKVFASEPDKLRATSANGQYVLFFHKADCTTPGEACSLLPYASTLGDETLGTEEIATSTHRMRLSTRKPEAWFSFHVERPDGTRPQQLRIFAAEELSRAPVIDSVSILAADGTTLLENWEFLPVEKLIDGVRWRVWELSREVYGRLEDSFVGGTAEGTKYYLKLLQLPSALSDYQSNEVLVGWQTNLTWIYGPQLGGDDCNLKCEDSQEAGWDEIWMKLGQKYSPNYVNMFPVGGGEAKDGVELHGHFNEVNTIEWTQRFFSGLTSRTHPDGTTFQKLPAMNFTEELLFQLFEDDRNGDEREEALYRTAEGSPAVRYLSGRHTLTYEDTFDDGEYKLSACNLSRTIQPKPCLTDADCDPELACVANQCVAH